ncbi:UPF0287-domain-containing protein [Epithele typhae]|uniref:UPF0287-domain-containing protein n=1 Tax=Epithele typhae TaxID=378194 RepID=UPI00200732B1|nr:UPF0287-domain-containing protein [Epithele typhae]KAH9946309.1 UPF0287-domain-containing protein [Epithele typhae]
MHPQLTEKKLGSHPSRPCARLPILVCACGTDRSLSSLSVCLQFIQALEVCHSDGGWQRFFGGCNQAKHELNMCLRKERVDRTTRNREQAKERREKIEQAWQEIRDD